MLYKYKTTMKNVVITLLFLFPFISFSQKHFTHEFLVKDVSQYDRWENDVNIFLFGDYTKRDSLIVLDNILLFNSLIETIKIKLVSDIDSANSVIYFLSDSEFKKIEPTLGLSGVGVNYITNFGDGVEKSVIQIDSGVKTHPDNRDHTIKHEMFHMLGFHHHQGENVSIMNTSLNFSDSDKEMIKYLYSKNFEF